MKKLISKEEIETMTKEDAIKLFENMFSEKLGIDLKDYDTELQSNLPLNMSLNLWKIKKN